MYAESLALLRALLAHHRFVCVPRADGTFPPRGQCTRAYTPICDTAGVPHIARAPGVYLRQVAEWCAARGFPPLNALAVNADSGIPGYNYDGAGGFSLANWETDVEECIRFRGYPQTPEEAGLVVA